MNRQGGILVLAALAILCTIVIIGLKREPHIEPARPESPAETAAAGPDAGSLDSMLDAVHVEHLIKHGR